MIVEDYWAGIARRLEIESGVLNGLIPHNLEKGMQNELSLARMLEKLVPPSIGVGSGLVFDHLGGFSKQMDIVLFDKSAQPQLMAQTTQVLFPVETVKALIEVKTSLTANDIQSDFPSKKASVAKLKPLDGYEIPRVGLFGYSFADSNYGRAEELTSLKEHEAPDIACVIDPGFTIAADGLAGFVPLIDATDESNGHVESRWMRPPADEKVSDVLIDGIHHPVYMLGKYTGKRFVGDPGRALLIFCMNLLELIGQDGQYAWIREYARTTMRALQALSGDAAALESKA